MVGYNSGGTCETGSNNTFLGTNIQLYPGEQSLSNSIALGGGAVITNYNQLMVASDVTSFNISGLTASTGSGEGTILEFDSSGNIIPSAGTYNTVSKIETELSSLKSGVAINSVDITILLSGGTVFTTSGRYSVPLNKTTLTIEAMGGDGEGSSGGTGSDGAWAGGGGGGSGALEKITIPVTNAGVSCGGGGGMGSVNTSTYGTGGTGTIPGQDSTIYETLGSQEQSGNGGLNNLGQLPLLDSAFGMGGAGGGPLAGYGVGSSTSTTTGATNGTYGSGGGGALLEQQTN